MYAAAARQDTEALVEQHVGLVKRIAHHLLGRLPGSVQVEDLIQAGIVGLLQAARQFDPSHGASFETYAGHRVRGAMLDELRRGGWTPRSVHRNTRRIAEAVCRAEQRAGGPPGSVEIAAELEVEMSEYQQMLTDIARSRVLSFQELTPSGGSDEESVPGAAEAEPLAVCERDSMQAQVSAAITELPERERLVLALYYQEELNLREIGEVLQVSESRVCQLHGQALVRIRARLQGVDAEAGSG